MVTAGVDLSDAEVLAELGEVLGFEVRTAIHGDRLGQSEVLDPSSRECGPGLFGRLRLDRNSLKEARVTIDDGEQVQVTVFGERQGTDKI